MSGMPYIKHAMKNLALVFACFLLLNTTLVGQTPPPEWATREYAGNVERVFSAALLSLQEQHHEVKSEDTANHSVEFHVGVTAWSWGYNMRLTATPVDGERVRVVVGVSRSGGKAASWGSGKKEVRKILAGIDAELAAAKSGLK